MDQKNYISNTEDKNSSEKKTVDPGSTGTSRKSQGKLPRKTSKVSVSARLGGITRYEIEIDEWHTREAIENSVTKPKVSGDTKSTRSSFYLPTLGTDFNLVMEAQVQLPELETLERTDAIMQLGELLQLKDYRTNLISFWILETLITALKESQKFRMSQANQKMTIVWIVYVLKTIMIYGLKRRAMFEHLNELFMKASKVLKDSETIPSPQSLLIEEDTFEGKSSVVIERSPENKNNLTNQSEPELRKDGKEGRADSKISKGSKSGYRRSAASLRSLRFRKMKSASSMSLVRKAPDSDAEFYLLVNQIYDIFGSRFKYEVIYTVFSQPVYIETNQVCDTILKMKDPRKPDYLQSISKKSVSRSNKSKLAITDKRKPDRKKSHKEDFMQKVLKMLLEPAPSSQEQVKTEPVSLPYLQPLNEAVNEQFFQQHVHHLPRKSTKKSFTLKSNQDHRSAGKHTA